MAAAVWRFRRLGAGTVGGAVGLGMLAVVFGALARALRMAAASWRAELAHAGVGEERRRRLTLLAIVSVRGLVLGVFFWATL